MTKDQVEALRILSALNATYDDPEYEEMNRRSDWNYKNGTWS